MQKWPAIVRFMVVLATASEVCCAPSVVADMPGVAGVNTRGSVDAERKAIKEARLRRATWAGNDLMVASLRSAEMAARAFKVGVAPSAGAFGLGGAGGGVRSGCVRTLTG
jgi:hypothetical protein